MRDKVGDCPSLFLISDHSADVDKDGLWEAEDFIIGDDDALGFLVDGTFQDIKPVVYGPGFWRLKKIGVDGYCGNNSVVAHGNIPMPEKPRHLPVDLHGIAVDSSRAPDTAGDRC